MLMNNNSFFDENKSFEYINVKPYPQGPMNWFYRGEIVEVKLSGGLDVYNTRLDLASRGLITTSESNYIEPNGDIFHFSE